MKQLDEVQGNVRGWGERHELCAYHAAADLMQACGYDTSDFRAALGAVEEALEKVQTEQIEAVERFREGGVCFVGPAACSDQAACSGQGSSTAHGEESAELKKVLYPLRSEPVKS